MVSEKNDSDTIEVDESNEDVKIENDSEIKQEVVSEEPKKELSEMEKLQLEIDEKNKEIESLKDKMLRTQAQASNDKKRFKHDADLSAFETKKRLLKKMLDIRDNIDRALDSFNAEDDSQKVHYEGIKLIANQIDDMFAIEDIKELKAKGEMYDLLKHEIVARVPYDGPENRVIDIVQKGYTLNGKLLRAAKVAISMKKQKEKVEQSNTNETSSENESKNNS